MKNKYGISIVIPFYKGHDYIENTISSLVESLCKTNLDYEIIVINDSPNEKINYIKGFYKEIQIYNNKKNLGIAKTRNKGIKLSNQKFIYFIDQDDWVDNEFFIYIENMINQNYDVIITNFNEVRENNVVKHYNFVFKLLIKYWLTTEKLIKYGNMFKTIGQAVFKKEIINDFIETETWGSDDAYMFMDIFLRKDKLNIKYINKALLNYRFHEENYSKETDFHSSSLECFFKFSEENESISHMKSIIEKRYEGDLLLTLVSKIIKKLITM